MARDGDDFGFWKFFAKGEYGLHPVYLWHEQISDYQVGWAVAIRFQALSSIGSQKNFMATGAKHIMYYGSLVGYVVYDQYSRHAFQRVSDLSDLW